MKNGKEVEVEVMKFREWSVLSDRILAQRDRGAGCRCTRDEGVDTHTNTHVML